MWVDRTINKLIVNLLINDNYVSVIVSLHSVHPRLPYWWRMLTARRWAQPVLAACCRGGWCCGCSCRGGRCPGASPSHCASAWPAAACGSSPSLGGSGSRSSVRCQTLLPGDIGFLIRIGKRSVFNYITGKNTQFFGGVGRCIPCLWWRCPRRRWARSVSGAVWAGAGRAASRGRRRPSSAPPPSPCRPTCCCPRSRL